MLATNFGVGNVVLDQVGSSGDKDEGRLTTREPRIDSHHIELELK